MCAAAGCASLVHMQAARRQANAADQTDYLPGDGCGSKQCSSNFRPGQFYSNQKRMATALERGERLLIAWPRGLDAREVEVQPVQAARDAAARARIARLLALRAARRRIRPAAYGARRLRSTRRGPRWTC